MTVETMCCQGQMQVRTMAAEFLTHTMFSTAFIGIPNKNHSNLQIEVYESMNKRFCQTTTLIAKILSCFWDEKWQESLSRRRQSCNLLEYCIWGLNQTPTVSAVEFNYIRIENIRAWISQQERWKGRGWTGGDAYFWTIEPKKNTLMTKQISPNLEPWGTPWLTKAAGQQVFSMLTIAS